MLTLGIPPSAWKGRDPRRDPGAQDMGVQFETGVEVGRDISLDDLRRQGFRAFYLAVGASRGAGISCPGEDMPGVYTAIDFLRRVNLGETPDIGPAAAVIGGGNAAAWTPPARRSAWAQRSPLSTAADRDEMPADDEEIREAMAEGVAFRFLAAPAGITGQGRAESLRGGAYGAGRPEKPRGHRPVRDHPRLRRHFRRGAQKIDLGGMQDIATGGAEPGHGVGLGCAQTSVPDVSPAATWSPVPPLSSTPSRRARREPCPSTAICPPRSVPGHRPGQTGL